MNSPLDINLYSLIIWSNERSSFTPARHVLGGSSILFIPTMRSKLLTLSQMLKHVHFVLQAVYAQIHPVHVINEANCVSYHNLNEHQIAFYVKWMQELINLKRFTKKNIQFKMFRGFKHNITFILTITSNKFYFSKTY